MKKRTVKDFVALYAPEDEEKLVLIQDGISADKTFLDTFWVSARTKPFWIPFGQPIPMLLPWRLSRPGR